MVAVGFVGTGLIAWAHALAIEAMIDAGVVDASVAAVHDTDTTRAGSLADVTHAEVLPSAEAVVDRADAIWVCTPTAAHAGVVEAALAKRRAVYCEKPLAPTLAEAERLVAGVQAAGIVAQVGLVLRSAPVFRELRALLDSGRLGRPMTALLRDDQYLPVQGMYASTWRADVAVAGGGCLIEHSIHDVDILRFCLGDVSEVTARTAEFSGHRGIEDLAVVTMQHDSGATSEIVSIWHQILTRGSTRRLEVFCERGLVWLENEFTGPLHVETSDGVEVLACHAAEWVQRLPFAGDEVGLSLQAYTQADEAFLRAVVSGRTAEPSFGDALVAHRLVEAAYRSAASRGRPVAC